ncbi:MAG: hypothetical protein ACRD12_20025 [Acidimicrobiales bacterium]
MSPLFRTGFLLTVGVAVLYATSPVVTNGDSYLAFPTAVSMVEEGNIDLDEFDVPAVQQHYGIERHRGHSFDSYQWPAAVFAVPAVLGMKALHVVGVTPSPVTLVVDDRMGLVQLWSASLVTALATLFVFLLAYEHLPGEDQRRRRRLAALVGLGFATATAAWSLASRALWQHGPSLLLLAAAVWLAGRINRLGPTPASAAGLGALLAGAVFIRPTNGAPALALSAWMVVRHRRALLPYAAGAVSVGLVGIAVNAATYGQAVPYYSSPGRRLAWHADYFTAVAANLVSPARGLLLFSPVVLLAVAGLVVRHRRGRLDALDVSLAGAVVLQLLVVSASREAWWAGHSFGPRFMCDVLPLLAYLAVPAVDAAATQTRLVQAAAVALLAVGVVVNAQGAWFRAAHCWNVEPVDIDADPARVWSVRDAQVTEGWRAFVASPRRAVSAPCGDDQRALISP